MLQLCLLSLKIPIVLYNSSKKTSFQTSLVLILVRELLTGIFVYRSVQYLEFLKAALRFLLIDISKNNWEPQLHLKHMQGLLSCIEVNFFTRRFLKILLPEYKLENKHSYSKWMLKWKWKPSEILFFSCLMTFHKYSVSSNP